MNSAQEWRRRLVFWAGAVAVGTTAVLFAMGSEFANDQFRRLIAISPYLPLIVTPLGLALISIITRKVFPGAQGSGIPQTIASISVREYSARDAMLSLRIAVGKILLTLLGLMSGASVGREGPTVQIGASIMHSLGRFARFPSHDLERGLILAGGAAGVAAAFNTPLAGIVFAIEEMSRSFEHRTSGTMLIAVIIAGVTALAMLGDYSYFGHTSDSLNLGREWEAVFVCGIAGGLLGGLFSRTLIWSSKGLPGRLGAIMREKPVLLAASCGLILALLGIASGSSVYGTGYGEAKEILEGPHQNVPYAYGILKMLATIVSYVSGIPGGIFAPSLSAGAGFGADIAALMPYIPAGAVITLGMVGYFSGVVQAPITAFVIVMEMTENRGMVLSLMATSFIAYATSHLVCRTPLYQALAQGFLQKLTPPKHPAKDESPPPG